MLITMAQFPASYLIHVPRYDVSFIRHWTHGVGIRPNFWAMYYARYLGLGTRYEAGICMILGQNSTYQKMDIVSKPPIHADQSWKTIGRVRFLAKMWPTIKITCRTSFEKLFSCWSQWQNPQLHISFTCLATMWLRLNTWSIGITCRPVFELCILG